MYNHNYLHSGQKRDVAESRLVVHLNSVTVIVAVAEVQAGGHEQYALLVSMRVIKNTRFHRIGGGSGPKKAGTKRQSRLSPHFTTCDWICGARNSRRTETRVGGERVRCEGRGGMQKRIQNELTCP